MLPPSPTSHIKRKISTNGLGASIEKQRIDCGDVESFQSLIDCNHTEVGLLDQNLRDPKLSSYFVF